MKVKQFTSWSFSRYSDYKTCPAKAAYKHLDKLPEPPNKAMMRGSAIHKMAEDYAKGLTRVIPTELRHFSDDLELLAMWHKATPERIMVEESWAFTKEWGTTTWNDWTGCHLRVKMDVAFYNNSSQTMLTVVDWKTGRMDEYKKAAYSEQMELYVLAAMKRHEHVEEVRPWLAYIDHGITYPEAAVVYTRDELAKLEAIWARRTAPMLSDTTFAPAPSEGCRWCHYRKANGGPCKF